MNLHSPINSGTSTPQPNHHHPHPQPQSSSSSLSARRHQRQRSSVSVSTVKKRASNALLANSLDQPFQSQPQSQTAVESSSNPSTLDCIQQSSRISAPLLHHAVQSDESTNHNSINNPPDNSLSSTSTEFPQSPSPSHPQSQSQAASIHNLQDSLLQTHTSNSNQSINLSLARSPSPNLSLRTTDLDRAPFHPHQHQPQPPQSTLMESSDEDEYPQGDDVPLGSPIATSELEWDANQEVPLRMHGDSQLGQLGPTQDDRGLDEASGRLEMNLPEKASGISQAEEREEGQDQESLVDEGVPGELQVTSSNLEEEGTEHTTPLARERELQPAEPSVEQQREEEMEESSPPPPLPAKDPPSIHSSRTSSPILSQSSPVQPNSKKPISDSSNDERSRSPSVSSWNQRSISSLASPSPPSSSSPTSSLFKTGSFKGINPTQDSPSIVSRPGAIRRASLLSSSVNITSSSDGRASPSSSERNGIRPESPTTTTSSIGRRAGGILPLRSSCSTAFSSSRDQDSDRGERSGSTSPITPRRHPFGNQNSSSKQSKRMSLGYISSPTVNPSSKPGTPLSELRESPLDSTSSSSNGVFAAQQAQNSSIGYASARNSIASTASGLPSEEGGSSAGHGSLIEDTPVSSASGTPRRREDGETVMSTHKDLLGLIAKKERRCLELKEELRKEESELKILQDRWQSSVSKDLAQDHPNSKPLASNESSTSQSQMSSNQVVDSLPSLSTLSLEGISIASPISERNSNSSASNGQPQMTMPKTAQEAWRGLSAKLPAGLGSQLNAFLDGIAPPTQAAEDKSSRERKERDLDSEKSPLSLGVLKEDEEEEERSSNATAEPSTRPTSVATSQLEDEKFTNSHQSMAQNPTARTSKAAKRTSMFGGGFSSLQKQLEETLTGTSTSSGNRNQDETTSITQNKGWGNLSKRWIKEAKEAGNGLLAKAEKSIDEFIAQAPLEQEEDAAARLAAERRKKRNSMTLPFSPKSPPGDMSSNQYGSSAGRDHRDSALWNKILTSPSLAEEEPAASSPIPPRSPISPGTTTFSDQNEKEKDALKNFGNGWFAFANGKNDDDEGKSNRLSPTTLLSLSDGIAPVGGGGVTSNKSSNNNLSPNGVDRNRRSSSGTNSSDGLSSSRTRDSMTSTSSSSRNNNTTGGGGIFEMLASALSGGELPPTRTSQESNGRKSVDTTHKRTPSVGGRSSTRLAAQSAVRENETKTSSFVVEDDGFKNGSSLGGQSKKKEIPNEEEDDWNWSSTLQDPIQPSSTTTTSPSNQKKQLQTMEDQSQKEKEKEVNKSGTNVDEDDWGEMW